MTSKASQTAALETLRGMRGGNSDDFIAMKDAYTNVGRDSTKPSDKAWMYNRLSSMRGLDLFTKEYEVRGGMKVLKGLRLTEEGRRTLGYSTAPSTPIPRQQRPETEPKTPQGRIDRVIADIEILKSDFPQFDIDFTMTLKKKEVGVK